MTSQCYARSFITTRDACRILTRMPALTEPSSPAARRRHWEMLVLSLVATYIPARRVFRINPIVAMQQE